jgi:hypothetical protein
MSSFVHMSFRGISRHSVLVVAVAVGCHHASKPAPVAVNRTCPVREASTTGATPNRVRIDGPVFRVGDRVVLVVDDSTRGITVVRASASGTGFTFDSIPGVSWPRAEEIESATVLKQFEVQSRVTPCEVEGGMSLRTKRSGP